VERRGSEPAAQFELLDDVGDLLKTVGITMGRPSGVRDHQEGGPLKKDDLIRLTEINKRKGFVLRRKKRKKKFNRGSIPDIAEVQKV